jgi:predicted RNA-binding Zn-ribbon protein involved in translation (DUF1610 family)
MDNLTEKNDTTFESKATKWVNEEQAEVQHVLFQCPKCECLQIEHIGKKAYFSALFGMIIGCILAFLAPIIMFIKIFIYIITFKFDKIRKMLMRELWSKYIIWLKCWLIILTFGLANFTKKYKCQKCGTKWVV